tara:strand:- start:1619 stop:3058 length:1440 start_codon:yes stop_codon:yes gene_type:complete
MNNSPILPIILCGGAGSRLWPLSRSSYPKQYLDLITDCKKSLLQMTICRLQDLETKAPVLICNEEHRFIAAEQLREINIKPKSIILEPVSRNTAPAIAIAALDAIEKGEDPLLLILAADHLIKNNKRFLEAITAGKEYAERGNLVTFGIVPTAPETGYGYIESAVPLKKNVLTGEVISRFIEKPNLENALKFIEDDKFTWNSGMFLFKASTILEEIDKSLPKVLKACRTSFEEKVIDLDFKRIGVNSFKNCENISIDVAVMQKTNKGIVIPLDVGWSDIGNWKSLWESTEKDNKGNVLVGNTIIKDSTNSYFRSENRLLIGLGVEDLIVIETSDAVLVANKNNAEKVKDIVSDLVNKNIPEAIQHRKIYRPWGSYISVVEGSRWQVKRIEVNPGGVLSLQMHHHRTEHWIVVKGTANVEVNESNNLLGENESVYIPLGSKHRLSNPGKIPLVLIEVQSGAYLDEDDIIRFADNYGRKNT